jgi:hypothetical protein
MIIVAIGVSIAGVFFTGPFIMLVRCRRAGARLAWADLLEVDVKHRALATILAANSRMRSLKLPFAFDQLVEQHRRDPEGFGAWVDAACEVGAQLGFKTEEPSQGEAVQLRQKPGSGSVNRHPA